MSLCRSKFSVILSNLQFSNPMSKEDKVIPLDAKKQVTVRKFNNVNLVDIREFYTDKNGDKKPGKKGISLTEEVWRKLIESRNEIEEALDGLNGGKKRKSKAIIESGDESEDEPPKKKRTEDTDSE